MTLRARLVDDQGGRVAKAAVYFVVPLSFLKVASAVSKNQDGTSFMHRDRGQRFTFLVKG